MTAAEQRAAVLATAPLTYWPLTDPGGSTVVADVAGNRPGVTLGTSPVVFGVPDPWGGNGAARFDGSAFVGGQQLQMTAPAPLSMAMWYRVTNALPGAVMLTLNGAADGTHGNSDRQLRFDNDRLMAFVYPWLRVDAVTSTDGDWHHGAYTYAVGGDLVLYRDGLEVSRLDTTTQQPDVGPVMYAAFMVAGRALDRWYAGDLCHIGLWDRALDPEEVNRIYHSDLPPEPPPPVGPTGCKRRAWLTLGALEMDLHDEPRGNWVCLSLDIGWPEIREVVDNRPDAHGVDDRTALFGSRVVSTQIMAGPGRRTIDDLARAFGPFMVPNVRPELHWTLNTPEDGYAERMLTLRAAAYASPIVGPWTREISLGWTAPDPIIYDSLEQSTIARPAGGEIHGRRYDLRFDRQYEPGGAGVATIGVIINEGDTVVYPVVRLYGPVTAPWFSITVTGADGLVNTLRFLQSFHIDAGHFVDVDCGNHTAISDEGQREEGQINWIGSSWPYAAGNGVRNELRTGGESVDWITQTIATWRNAYLTP